MMEEYIFSLFGDIFSDGGLIESTVDDVFGGMNLISPLIPCIALRVLIV